MLADRVWLTDGHLADSAKHVRNRDVSDKRLQEVTAKVQRIIQACGFTRIGKINDSHVEDMLGLWRSDGMSKQTSNHSLRAIKQFCSWLVRTGRAESNPVADIPLLNVQTDRRHDRRPLTPEELARLVQAAESGKPVESISGPDRAMVYVLSAWTGYRKGEIGSLNRNSFDLQTDPPTVTVEAVSSKRKRRDVQVLHPSVVERLTVWLSGKDVPDGELLFPVSANAGGVERKTAKMMRHDLAAARAGWITEAGSEQERSLREQSDLLCYQDRQGRYADFHSNRHTFITNLARAGVSPKTAQTLARHSDIRLTMNVYTHTDLAEKADAVGRLPGLWEWPESQADRKGRSVSASGTDTTTTGDTEESPEADDESQFDATGPPLSADVASTPGRIRTCGLRFRKPQAISRTVIGDNELRETGFSLGVTGECANVSDCRCSAENDAATSTTIQYLTNAWPKLPPHIRDAIFTLIDASLDQQAAGREES